MYLVVHNYNYWTKVASVFFLIIDAQKNFFNGGKINHSKKKLTTNNVVVRDIFVKKIVGPYEP